MRIDGVAIVHYVQRSSRAKIMYLTMFVLFWMMYAQSSLLCF